MVRVCLYSPSCQIFPHSLSAFIIMKLPKQLQPSQQEPWDSCSSTRAVLFLSHAFCSAQPHSRPLVSISCGIGLEQRRAAKAVVWWAWLKVESSPRWPLSGDGGGGDGLSRGFDGVMDWCHSGQTCSAEVMISSRWWKRHNSNLFWVLFFLLLLLLLIAGIESWHEHFALLKAMVTSGHLYSHQNSIIMIIIWLFFSQTFLSCSIATNGRDSLIMIQSNFGVSCKWTKKTLQIFTNNKMTITWINK